MQVLHARTHEWNCMEESRAPKKKERKKKKETASRLFLWRRTMYARINKSRQEKIIFCCKAPRTTSGCERSQNGLNIINYYWSCRKQEVTVLVYDVTLQLVDLCNTAYDDIRVYWFNFQQFMLLPRTDYLPCLSCNLEWETSHARSLETNCDCPVQKLVGS